MLGKQISHYRILEQIGSGGMGDVYLAEDTKLKRNVALKFLPKEFTKDKEAVERIQREAQAAAALNHPNIITIYEINEHEDQIYIAMEYVEGKTLKASLTSDPLPLARVIDITLQICEGLSAAHEQGIVHRDIKPQNIMIDHEDRIKILDFGLAKLKGASQLTQESSTLGTVHYMSPEQARGAEVDQRTDIWSLGVILYEMLTGQYPFKGDYEQAVIYSIVNEEPESQPRLKSDYPPDWNRIISKALVKDPKDRYHSIKEIKTDLSGRKMTEMDSMSREREMRPKSKIMSKPLTIGLGVIILTILIGIGYLRLNRPVKTGPVIDPLAVLPLENLSGDPEQEYFSDGMTEALITEISRIKALKVISRTSVMRFKKTRQSLPEIARQLKVAAVVEGSVLKAGDKVRITTQLIETPSDKHLWAESYERDLKDILGLQKEVARTIAEQIRATLTPLEKSELSEVTNIDPTAHEAFLKGHYFLKKITVKDAQKAIDFFDQVIKMEPEFAPGYAGKALAYDTIVSYNAVSPKQGWQMVREWAEKALKFDPKNSDAVMLMADVKFILEWDWLGAENDYKLSIQLNPNNSIAYNWYATFLSSMGRNKEALEMSNRAIALAPLTIDVYYNGILARLNAGMFDQAEDLLTKVKELFPHHPVSLGIQGLMHLRQNNNQEALRLFESQLNTELSPGMKDMARVRMAFALAQLGKKKKSREMLEYLIDRSKNHYISPYWISLTYLALDEIDGAFLWLEKAYSERCDDLVHELKPSPHLNPIRPDPRFRNFLKKMKLEP